LAVISPLKKALVALSLLSASACVHARPTPAGPEAVARDFAAHLRAGQLEQAWALSAGLTREAFLARYADAGRREQRATAVHRAALGERAPAALQLSYAAEGWRVQEQPDAAPSAAEVQQALAEFLDAADRRDFPAAWTMLSARWRARYTPARLQSDFDIEPQVKERLARARAALAGPWRVEKDSAALGLGEGRTLKLEREGELWRVAALE
jgi:hypothetical protein